jgi:hypothetical protein
MHVVLSIRGALQGRIAPLKIKTLLGATPKAQNLSALGATLRPGIYGSSGPIGTTFFKPKGTYLILGFDNVF